MQVNRVQANYSSTIGLQNRVNNNNSKSLNNVQHQDYQTSPFKKLPLNFKYNASISFSGFSDVNATVPDIEFEEYNAMTDTTKKRIKKRYEKFFSDKSINKNELYDTQHFQYMPLNTEQKFDDFVKFSSLYNDFKDRRIISIGRSPKWFLNTSVWMKDGIDGYDFAAFSGNWFRRDPKWGIIPVKTAMPTEKEYKAYTRYLKQKGLDPLSIVKDAEKTGKRTIYTDYVQTGRGVSSFLDIMSRFAEEQGVLEKFSKSIEIIGIGSLEYNEMLNPYEEYVETPEVLYPERLKPYEKNIKQKFYSMPADIQVDMLINQNTNECRSTYYPHTAWTLYNPDTFKTGMVRDMKKIEAVAKELKDVTTPKAVSSFSPAMRDYRNLLNFRILDGLAKRGLLTARHVSKV